MAETMTYTAARADLAATIDKVVNDRVSVIIRKKNESVVMMSLAEYEAWADYLYWQQFDKKTLKRINTLLKECMRTPYEGIGKPEALRGNLSTWWSRRITGVDRLVYKMDEAEDTLLAAQLRYHY